MISAATITRRSVDIARRALTTSATRRAAGEKVKQGTQEVKGKAKDAAKSAKDAVKTEPGRDKDPKSSAYPGAGAPDVHGGSTPNQQNANHPLGGSKRG